MEVYAFTRVQCKWSQGWLPYLIFLRLFILELLIRHAVMVAAVWTLLMKCITVFILFCGFIMSQEIWKSAYWVKYNVHLRCCDKEVNCWILNFLKKIMYGVFSEVAMQTRCEQQCTGSRPHFNWPQHLIWLTPQSIPGPSVYPGVSFITSRTKK